MSKPLLIGREYRTPTKHEQTVCGKLCARNVNYKCSSSFRILNMVSRVHSINMAAVAVASQSTPPEMLSRVDTGLVLHSIELVFTVCCSVLPVSSWSLLCVQKLHYIPYFRNQTPGLQIISSYDFCGHYSRAATN